MAVQGYTSEVPVGVQLYDVRDARVPLVEEVVHLLPGAGECMSLRLAHRDRLRGVHTVFAAVSVEAESVDRTPVLASAEPRGGVQFVGLLLPAVQSVREAGPDAERPPPPPV